MTEIIFDAHQDILLHERDEKKEIVQTGFDALVKSGIKLVVAAIFLDPDKVQNLTNQEKAFVAEEQLEGYLKVIRKNRKLMLVKDLDSLQKLMHSDLTGILLHIEGVDFINENNLDLVDKFYARGLRSVGLVWGQDNYIAGYSDSDSGLTDFGKKFIAKLNEKNIIIDLAHANEKTFDDVLILSRKPIMVSHGNSYELCPTPRNFKASQLEKLANKGGVQGIFFSRKYVSGKDAVKKEDVIAHFVKSYQINPKLTMLGTDFGGISSGFVEDWDNLGRLPEIIKLIKKELGQEAAEKISYMNFLSFLKKNYEN